MAAAACLCSKKKGASALSETECLSKRLSWIFRSGLRLKGRSRGLQNVAFPPSYLNHQRFYVSYTDTNGDTVISRFYNSADPDRADSDSEEIILTIKQPGALHNGGTLKFARGMDTFTLPAGTALDPVTNIFRSIGTRSRHVTGQDLAALMLSRARNLTRFRLTIRLFRYPATRRRYGRWGCATPGAWPLTSKPAISISRYGLHTNEEVNFQPADSGGGRKLRVAPAGRSCFH